MSDLILLTQFFGWSLLINAGILLFTTIMLISFRPQIKSLQSQLFALEKAQLNIVYFKYLAYYKIGIILFSLTPYLSLKIMTSA
ncbi:DUF6868 family protein [Rheinheimera salexigens]|uniref:DUF6868 domain-containing protein n=1 Tax=Rheinheimera salexigens TaxID=1628148 RepID=A0A1E7Q313_9GAMM|nr:hypothetical protein BI198_02430 [Rheinheimera salexigens]